MPNDPLSPKRWKEIQRLLESQEFLAPMSTPEPWRTAVQDLMDEVERLKEEDEEEDSHG